MELKHFHGTSHNPSYNVMLKTQEGAIENLLSTIIDIYRRFQSDARKFGENNNAENHLRLESRLCPSCPAHFFGRSRSLQLS